MARIAALNADFRGKPAPTNVLSWPSGEGPAAPGEPRFLGDLALAWETCLAEAEAAGIAPADHVTHLVVHGVLHLVGYDHADGRRGRCDGGARDKNTCQPGRRESI